MYKSKLTKNEVLVCSVAGIDVTIAFFESTLSILLFVSNSIINVFDFPT